MLEREVAGCKEISHLFEPRPAVARTLCLASRLIVWLEPVTDPGLSEYVFWVCRISFDLFS
jgi:hypothetical protein